MKVAFFPLNTTSLIQPMDQEVIANFKTYYFRNTFAQAVKVTTGENGIILQEFLKKYDIKQAIANINDVQEEVTASSMRSVWQKILLECANDFPGFDTPIINVIDEFAAIEKSLGFEEIDAGNVCELFFRHMEKT